ncbi:MAG: ubiquitin-like domain-containing protein [Candidatus Saccharimonadales bacterium]
MRSIIRTSNTPMRAFIIAGVFLAIMTAVIAIARVANAQETATPAPNGRLITVHDRGTEKVFLSQANTVGGALKEAGIPFDATDSIEPAASEPLVATDYQVNIYRSRPVIVVDGTSSRVVMTPYQTPAQIAKHADITLYDEDTTSINPTDDIISEGAGLRMTIDRATQFAFTLYGKKIDARTQGATVGDMLKEKGITLAANDILSVAQSTPITAGMAIELWRNGVQTMTQDEEVKFETEQIKDADQPVGYKKVQTPGVLGKRTVTYEVEMKNGQELSRKEIQSVTTAQPQKQVEVIGDKQPPVAGPAEIIAMINTYSAQHGLDANKVARIAKCESTFNPNATNGIYQGLFQHHSGYWPARATKYGAPGASIFDAAAQVKVTTAMMAEVGYGPWECQ